jgi:two-component system nitrogen regulation sensor histidine kinase NtrY
MTSAEHVAAEAAFAAGPSKMTTRWLGPFAVAVALISAFATFVVLAGLTRVVPTHEVVVGLLLTNAVTIVILLAIIARELWQIVQSRRHGRAGARLHVRIVGLFSLIAAAPAVLVSIVASLTLDRGLDQLFSTRVQAVIGNSSTIADAYMIEHAGALRNNIILMSMDIARNKQRFDQDRAGFLTEDAAVRGLPAAMVINDQLEVVERANPRLTQTFVMPPKATLATINDTEPQIAVPDPNYVAAIIKLRGYDDLYLYVARPLDATVVTQVQQVRAGAEEYQALAGRRAGIQVAFALMYTVIALIVLLSAVWIGLNFANLMVLPIRRLIGAAGLVSTGNLRVQVPVKRSEGDLAHLGETFNKMTQELATQHEALVRARDQIDSRRRFTEAVLAGASAGVIGVDAQGRISILNRSAEKLIGFAESEVLGKPLAEVVPELAEVLTNARATPQRQVQGQLTLSRNGRECNLSIRVTSEQSAEALYGYVITLDDITELVSAQRTSAWADVARRIAHEIKNPLTPIQLSAERLRRKYGRVITEDRGVFDQCTDTIVRQVDDIKRMVDEFSRFARMPKPVLATDNVADAVRQTVFLMRVGYPDITIEAECAEDPLPARFDRRLVSQALTNIIKNATEAIAAVPPAELGRGQIRVSAAREGEDVVVDVVDNGIGLPKENRNRLLEPYVTTREKGTGLGLAIVGRILEDHGGKIELRDAGDKIPGARGAWVRLRFRADAPGEAAQTELPKAANEG